jgi:Glycosyl hydrolase-like 10
MRISLGEKIVLKISGSKGVLGSLILGLVFNCIQPVRAEVLNYCRFTTEAIATKENLRLESLQGNLDAEKLYLTLLKEHAEFLNRCRNQNWPSTQAIWLRLYPCDVRLGSIDAVLDRIVNLGYNQIYLEVFFDGQVLLPPADNPTPWLSVVRSRGDEKVDLLAQTIQKGRERGLKVYAWMFTLNFGYAYAQRPDRQEVLARNGKRENSISFVEDQSQAFIDPYNRQAQTDYYQLLQAVLQRRPDGVLFDYVRYPRGSGSKSAIASVKDLWIYGDASLKALYQRAENPKARALIERYVNQGHITLADIVAVDKLYPQDKIPRWEGRKIVAEEVKATAQSRYQIWRSQLWYLSIAHAIQGILDFLNFVSLPVQSQNIPTGAVFFPYGNQISANGGLDSRLQPWDKFPPTMEWHPMSYAICNGANCIVEEVKRVIGAAGANTKIVPALAGVWGNVYKDHPPLEVQMQAIRKSLPRINALSHFAYSWQEPELDRERRFCKLEQ